MVTTFGGSGPNHATVATNAARISSVAMAYIQNEGRTSSGCFSVMVIRTPIRSGPPPEGRRIVEWLAHDECAAAFAEDFDLELGAWRGEIGTQVCEREAAVQP